MKKFQFFLRKKFEFFSLKNKGYFSVKKNDQKRIVLSFEKKEEFSNLY